MNAKKFTVLTRLSIVLLIVFFNYPVDCQTESCLQNLDHPDYRSITQDVSGGTIKREYILHVPPSYNDNTSSALVINLHGFGDCASDYSATVGNFYNFNELANQESFLVAYPQGAYRPEKEDTYWEPGDNGGENLYENDVYFIEQLILDIASEYNLDLNRIFACGYSNGGMMAYSLACNKSDLFSAIGIMSGTMLEEECMLSKSVPIIKFHGIADEVLPYDGNMWYQSVSEVVNFWLAKNNIPSGNLMTTQLNEGKVEREEYLGNDEESCLTLYTIYEEWDKPGDHVWFSDDISGASPNEIMWKFFSGNCSQISSVEENTNLNGAIKIQPNPFFNQITVESKQVAGQKFSIYNSQGVCLTTGEIASNKFTIELDFLPSNIYIIKIGGQARKLLKLD